MNEDREKKQLCLFCAHFDLEGGTPGYSEYTPGSPFSMYCLKGHWDLDDVDDTVEHREVMLRAERCSDFVYYKDKELADRLRSA